MKPHRHEAWAVKWTQDNQLDGHREYLYGGARYDRPIMFNGSVIMLFKTRQACREFIKDKWGYIATRHDLRVEPHCWRVPKAVRVTVTTEENA